MYRVPKRMFSKEQKRLMFHNRLFNVVIPFPNSPSHRLPDVLIPANVDPVRHMRAAVQSAEYRLMVERDAELQQKIDNTPAIIMPVIMAGAHIVSTDCFPGIVNSQCNLFETMCFAVSRYFESMVKLPAIEDTIEFVFQHIYIATGVSVLDGEPLHFGNIKAGVKHFGDFPPACKYSGMAKYFLEVMETVLEGMARQRPGMMLPSFVYKSDDWEALFYKLMGK